MNVIYQTAEDGLADTIKPRLESAGADCTRVLLIDEGKRELTLCDARLEEAIRRTGAKLIVLDPLQAYLGSDVDMHRANEVRPVLKRLSLMAERTQCAVILIGHMNKAQGLKSGYRGLGSIDFRASARSVLIVGRLKSGDTLRIVAQDKNSLAPEGAAIAFELHPEHGFQWKGFCDATVDNILNGTGQVADKDHADGRRAAQVSDAAKTSRRSPCACKAARHFRADAENRKAKSRHSFGTPRRPMALALAGARG